MLLLPRCPYCKNQLLLEKKDIKPLTEKDKRFVKEHNEHMALFRHMVMTIV